MISDLIENFIETSTTVDENFNGAISSLKLVPNFLTKTECKFFISLVAPDSNILAQQLLNRKRLIIDSEKMAEWFWNRLKPFNEFKTVIDEHGDTWTAVGINPRFRIVRYDAGNKFARHQDGFYWPEWNQRTFATAMVYLNDATKDENGKVCGATRFYDISTVVEPKQGLLVTFLVNDLDHCGEECNSQKYLLRTDIVYRLEVPKKDNIEQWNNERQEIFAEFLRMSS